MDNGRRLRLLCAVLVAAVLALSLILVVAVCSREADEGAPEETTRRSFWELLPDGIPELGTFNWEDMTFDFPSQSGGEGTLPVEPPEDTTPSDEPVTLAPWESGLEWPTLPPSEPDPDREWPTIPADWETLPQEWSTLPADWEADLDVGDIADELAGVSGSLGRPQGALGAGIASQLTMMEIQVDRDDRLYLKMQSLGVYEGHGWGAAPEFIPRIGNKYSAQYLPHFVMNRIDQKKGFFLWINPIMDTRVVPYYITTHHNLSEIQGSDVQATGSTEEPYVLFYRHYATYSAGNGSLDGNEEKDDLFTFEDRCKTHAYQQYTDIDSTTAAYMKLIIDEQGFDKNDPYVVEKVAEYIRNAAVYDLNYNQNLDREPNVALAFLGGYKEGVCRHFATAATLLYRALGIPARYTVGFMVDATGGAITAVKGMDAHAWVEVYEDGFGWRYVEVTGSPAGEEKPPEKPTLRIKPAYLEKQYDGEPLIHSGDVEGLGAYLSMGYTYLAEISHDDLLIGTTVAEIRSFVLMDPDGRDVTSEFSVFYGENTMRVYYETLLFTSSDVTKSYDGKPLMADEVTLLEGVLSNRFTYEMIPVGTQTSVGTSMASFSIRIYEKGEGGLGEDVTDHFNVFRYYGALTVTPATLTLKAADAEKVYDGTPLTASAIEMIGGGLAEGDTIEAYTVVGSRTRIGRSDNVITDVTIRNADGDDVTRNYMIETIVGTLRVKSS